jgi:hypothetical protein
MKYSAGFVSVGRQKQESAWLDFLEETSTATYTISTAEAGS